MPKSKPWYPNRELSYGQIYFFLRQKVYSINPFDKEAIKEGKRLMLQEARAASPNYKTFITAAKLSTNLSERTIKKLMYNIA